MEGADVIVAGYVRPVSGEYLLAVWVDFDLSDALVACSFESKVYSSDSGEEA